MNEFPQNPFQILDPNIRWAPSQEELQEKAYEQLIPPLVYKIRLVVKEWRDIDYSGVSDTTKALLKFWFKNDVHKKTGTFFNIILPSAKSSNLLFTCMKSPKPKINMKSLNNVIKLFELK